MEGEVNDISFFGTTIPLYADDCYLKEFDARVLRAGPGYVILDRSAFYPESGGQPSDTGILFSGQQAVRVKGVVRRGGVVYHQVDGALPPGAAVHGVIDWERRYLNMRRHSGEHLLTGLFEKVGAGPKVYSDITRLEFQPSPLNIDTLRTVEAEFRRIIDEDIPIRIYYVPRDEIDVGGDLRKRQFLERIPRGVKMLRMVEIPGYSLTFCFGTHVKSTGEIGRLSKLELVEGKRLRKTVIFDLETSIDGKD
jgi:Ser-tRNA(Ala) deacylase AlaX